MAPPGPARGPLGPFRLPRLRAPRWILRLLGEPLVRRLRVVMAAYGDAGGALLAEGLAYAGLFALLPALLLLAGIAGAAVQDPARRASVVTDLAAQVPPLAGIIEESLAAASRGAVPFSLLGILGLAWGASRFYGSLDSAFALVFTGERRRGMVAQTVRGVASVLLLVVAFVGALVLGGVASFLEGSLAVQLGDVGASAGRVLSPLLAALVIAAAMIVAYRVLPTQPLPLRRTAPVGLVVGVALAVLTDAFALVAPRLIGSASVYGTFVAVFAALVWLSLCFQLILLGATWLATGPGGSQEATALARRAAGLEPPGPPDAGRSPSTGGPEAGEAEVRHGTGPGKE